jgi:hypothetical protein
LHHAALPAAAPAAAASGGGHTLKPGSTTQTSTGSTGAEAAGLLREALEGRTAKLGPAHPHKRESQRLLARVEEAQRERCKK